MLAVRNLSAGYEKIPVIFDINLEVQERTIVALVGPNAAGKTTLLKVISGLLKPQKGIIEFLGERIDNLPPYDVHNKGITLIPEGRGIFPTLTVLENLEMGAYSKTAREKSKDSLQRVFNLFPILYERKYQKAASLSGGEQQMLAIGRALMSIPKILLIDEMSIGLAPKLVTMLFKLLKEINVNEGVTLLIVDQNIYPLVDIADKAHILSQGRIVREGKVKELLSDEKIVEQYFGLT